VVDCIQRLVHPVKVGHAGTLDPLATGVLLVCIGPATRLISRVQSGQKTYIGRFVLGQRSSTEDVEGTIVPGGDCSRVERSHVELLLPEFVGSILQTPPQVSALKVGGQRAYKLARRGVAVDLKPRPVDIYSLELTDFALPEFELRVTCGAGTYIRSLGRDIGERLGCGAVMSALCRTAIGSNPLEQAVSLQSLTKQVLREALIPPHEILPELPRRRLSQLEVMWVRQGRYIAIGELDSSELDIATATPDEASRVASSSREVMLIDEAGSMIGLAVLESAHSRLKPELIFPAETLLGGQR
jgi:tRNA pseudouridine55 synthase